MYEDRRKPKEEVVEFILGLGFIILEDFEYKNQKTKIKIEDKDGYRYFVSYGTLWSFDNREGVLSRFLKSNPYSIYNIDLWMKKSNYASEIIGGEYISEEKNTLELRCDKGHIFKSSWQKIRGSPSKNGCTICSGMEVIFETSFGGMFPELLDEWSPKNTISPYKVSWGNSDLKPLWICPNGHKDYPCSFSNKRAGKGCPSCGGKTTDENNVAVVFPEFLDEWDYENNGTPNNYAPYSNEMVRWICKKCGNNYPSLVYNRTLHGNGCPDCKSRSDGEDIIKDILAEYRIKYIFQKRFPDCKDKNTLPFDFYIPKSRKAIEFHGIQHYKPQEYFGGIKKFEDQIKKDKIKEKYCLDNNISLLVIPYWEIDNIEKILEQFLFE
jgi:hypothetical protein